MRGLLFLSIQLHNPFACLCSNRRRKVPDVPHWQEMGIVMISPNLLFDKAVRDSQGLCNLKNKPGMNMILVPSLPFRHSGYSDFSFLLEEEPWHSMQQTRGRAGLSFFDSGLFSHTWIAAFRCHSFILNNLPPGLKGLIPIQ